MQPTNDLEPALDNLSRLLEEWKKLTEAEKESIGRQDWSLLEHLQSKKVVFQRLIGESERSLFESDSLCPERKAVAKRHFRQLTNELLRLEEANLDFITQKLAIADGQRKLFEKTIRGLKHVQQAYGAGTRSFWHAYS